MILCVGQHRSLVELRCTVLQEAGYNTRVASIEEAEFLLLSETFGLVILSAYTSEHDKSRITQAAGNTPVIALDGVTFPSDLLNKVAGAIPVEALRS